MRSSARARRGSGRLRHAHAGMVLGDNLPDTVAEHWARMVDRDGEAVPQGGAERSMWILTALQKASAGR